MANHWVLGNTVVLDWTAKKLNDTYTAYVAYDVAMPTLILVDPNGVETTYTYPASPELVKPTSTTGTYIAILGATILHLVGLWKYKWLDPDPTTPGIIEGSFSISAPKIA